MQFVHDKRPVMSVVRALAVTLVLLAVLGIAMMFTTKVDWTGSDFIVAGTVLFVALLAIDLILHRVGSTRRRLIGVAVVILVLAYLWAELAVGVFTNLGS